MDIVVDVGGVYDPESDRYDHHQKEFQETFEIEGMESKGIRMSSAGLIYKHFGKEVLASMTREIVQEASVSSIDKDIMQILKKMVEDDTIFNEFQEELYQKVYYKFIRCIDAIDNGVDMVDLKPGQTLNFEDNTGLSTRIARLNPSWTESGVIDMLRFT